MQHVESSSNDSSTKLQELMDKDLIVRKLQENLEKLKEFENTHNGNLISRLYAQSDQHKKVIESLQQKEKDLLVCKVNYESNLFQLKLLEDKISKLQREKPQREEIKFHYEQEISEAEERGEKNQFFYHYILNVLKESLSKLMEESDRIVKEMATDDVLLQEEKRLQQVEVICSNEYEEKLQEYAKKEVHAEVEELVQKHKQKYEELEHNIELLDITQETILLNMKKLESVKDEVEFSKPANSSSILNKQALYGSDESGSEDEVEPSPLHQEASYSANIHDLLATKRNEKKVTKGKVRRAEEKLQAAKLSFQEHVQETIILKHKIDKLRIENDRALEEMTTSGEGELARLRKKLLETEMYVIVFEKKAKNYQKTHDFLFTSLEETQKNLDHLKHRYDEEHKSLVKSIDDEFNAKMKAQRKKNKQLNQNLVDFKENFDKKMKKNEKEVSDIESLNALCVDYNKDVTKATSIAFEKKLSQLFKAEEVALKKKLDELKEVEEAKMKKLLAHFEETENKFKDDCAAKMLELKAKYVPSIKQNRIEIKELEANNVKFQDEIKIIEEIRCEMCPKYSRLITKLRKRINDHTKNEIDIQLRTQNNYDVMKKIRTNDLFQ